jgi:hypothetical protein
MIHFLRISKRAFLRNEDKNVRRESKEIEERETLREQKR